MKRKVRGQRGHHSAVGCEWRPAPGPQKPLPGTVAVPGGGHRQLPRTPVMGNPVDGPQAGTHGSHIGEGRPSAPLAWQALSPRSLVPKSRRSWVSLPGLQAPECREDGQCRSCPPLAHPRPPPTNRRQEAAANNQTPVQGHEAVGIPESTCVQTLKTPCMLGDACRLMHVPTHMHRHRPEGCA